MISSVVESSLFQLRSCDNDLSLARVASAFAALDFCTFLDHAAQPPLAEVISAIAGSCLVRVASVFALDLKRFTDHAIQPPLAEVISAVIEPAVFHLRRDDALGWARLTTTFAASNFGVIVGRAIQPPLAEVISAVARTSLDRLAPGRVQTRLTERFVGIGRSRVSVPSFDPGLPLDAADLRLHERLAKRALGVQSVVGTTIDPCVFRGATAAQGARLHVI